MIYSFLVNLFLIKFFMKLSDSEKRDLIQLIEKDKFLPDKYRFLIFEKVDQVELIWNGKSSEITNVVLPFQIIEQVDEPRDEKIDYLQGSLIDNETGRQLSGWTNKLIWGDNKFVLSSLKNGPMRDEIERQGGIKLIYIDPPFDVGADFSMNVSIGDDLYEKRPNVLEQIAYRDTWGLGTDSFLSMIYERLLLMKDLLANDGSIFVHCDYRLNSSIRGIMDEVFGKQNFLNEIIWNYSGGRLGKKHFGRKHDTIFWYSKSDSYKFYPDRVREEYSEATKERFKSKVKNIRNGKDFGEQNLNKDGKFPEDVFNISIEAPSSNERTGYPTQKPLELLKKIILAASDEEDLIADFFCGSGTFSKVAELTGRKWICSDIGKFSIHTVRKRMIGVQRGLKEINKNWRAFEILNLGKYQRNYFIFDGKNERDELKEFKKKEKQRKFEKLILTAYKGFSVEGFKTLHGKKADTFISLGPINQPLSRIHVEEVIKECLKNNITSVDILGFEYEMGLFPTIQEEARDKGLRLNYKQIPMEIFDKRAISKNEVIFHDVAYIDFNVIKKDKKIYVELIDFAVFYSEDNLNIDEKLQKNKSKIVVEDGKIIEKSKDKDGNITNKLITNSWHDWIDYWSVDFNYESKKEFIKINKDGELKEIWTGNFVFENEWQSFRTINNEMKLEFISAQKEINLKKTKVAVKVVDIFGNDTMKLMDVEL